jgi:hypothetical protein
MLKTHKSLYVIFKRKYAFNSWIFTENLSFSSYFIKSFHEITVMVEREMNLNPEGGYISKDMWFLAIREF